MTILDITASSEIASLREELNGKAMAGHGLTMVESRIAAEKLRLIGALVGSMEQELSVFRLAEAGRVGAAVVEQLATDVLADPQGKVLRPDFGRKP